MSNTRPYSVRFNGRHHIVEGTSQEAAVRHVASALLEECKPARASDVVAFVRAGGTVETAGQGHFEGLELVTEKTPTPKVGDVIVPMIDGASLSPGDRIVADGDVYRRATEKDKDEDVVTIPEGAIQSGNVIWWPPAPEAKGGDERETEREVRGTDDVLPKD